MSEKEIQPLYEFAPTSNKDNFNVTNFIEDETEKKIFMVSFYARNFFTSLYLIFFLPALIVILLAPQILHIMFLASIIIILSILVFSLVNNKIKENSFNNIIDKLIEKYNLDPIKNIDVKNISIDKPYNFSYDKNSFFAVLTIINKEPCLVDENGDNITPEQLQEKFS